MSLLNRKTKKLVNNVAIVANVTTCYFLLTADYGPEPNALDPIKKRILSAESTVKEYFFGSKKKSQENHTGKLDSNRNIHNSISIRFSRK